MSGLCRPQQAVHIVSPDTGIVLDLYTDAPGVQFYAGNQLQQTVPGKAGVIYPVHGATVFETQVCPGDQKRAPPQNLA